MDSTLLPVEQTTRDTYDVHAEAWMTAHDTPGFWRDEMERFHRLLPAGDLLEIGCGAGRDAKELLRLGYGYTGIDFSAAMIALARARIPGADFRQQSVYDLNIPGRTFDGFWAAMSLLHTPKARMSEALTKIGATLRNEAAGFIALKQGTGEGLRESDTPRMTRFFAWWQKAEFAAVLATTGYQITDYWRAGSRHCFFVTYDGGQTGA
jgi:SAM-dependent methyltransferase